MKLFTDLTEDVQVISEEADGKKNWFIEGIWMQSERENRNHRIYPRSIMEREVNRYVDTYVAKNRAVGELGHPEGPSINLDRISHRIIELKMDGNNVVGKAQLLDTEKGLIAQKLLEGGVQLGVSSRGMGTLKANREGIMEVQEDFYLATAGDIVADPSAPDAWVNGIMEDVEWLISPNGKFERVIMNVRSEIETAVTKRELSEAKKIEIFSRFLKTLL